MPGHTSREILIILSSLTTCDPGNIYQLIEVEGVEGPPTGGPLLTLRSVRSDPEVSEGQGVGHWPVGRGAGVHGVDQGDGRHVPRHPG